MRNTKRLLSLILALVLCLAMTACASEEDKAFEAADALLAAGDYEGAIAAFSAIGRYQEISGKIAEAEKLRMEAERKAGVAQAEGLFGNWNNISTYYTDVNVFMTLKADGICSMSWGPDAYDSTFVYKDNTISLDNPVMDLKVVTQDGITHLISEEYSMDFVPEADVAAFTPIDIEITPDNWQEYFEMKEVDSIRKNAFGEVESVFPSIGFFLKEEYYERLPSNYWDLDISFEISYDETCYKVLNCTPEEFDYNFSGQYEKEPAEAPSWWEVKTGCTTIGQVQDTRGGDWLPEENPFYNTISCEIGMYGGSASTGKTLYLMGWTNIQVSRVIGTLRLYPAK